MANQGDKRREGAARATVDLAEIDAKSAGLETRPSEHLRGSGAYDEGLAGEHKRLEMLRAKSQVVVRRRTSRSRAPSTTTGIRKGFCWAM